MATNAERMAKWRAKNKEKDLAYKRAYRQREDYPFKVRKERLRRMYGISQEDYEILLEQQNGCCAICGSANHGGNKSSNHFQIDHDHMTGKVRGLLCASCNRGLGLLGDSIENIEKVLTYLRGNKNG